MNRLQFVFNTKKHRKKTRDQALINHNLNVYIDGKKAHLVQDFQLLASVSNGSQLVRASVKMLRTHEDGSICLVDGGVITEELNPGLMTDSLIVEKIERDEKDALSFHLRRTAIT